MLGVFSGATRLFGVGAFVLGALLVGPAPGYAQVPLCVAGEWRAVNLEQSFRDLFGPDTGFQIESITGDVTMSLSPNGGYVARYERYRMVADSFGSPFEIVMEGSLRGAMREVRPGALSSSVTESDVTVTTVMMGTTTTGPLPLVGEDTGEAINYDCAAGQLTFAVPGETSFRLNFVRR